VKIAGPKNEMTEAKCIEKMDKNFSAAVPVISFLSCIARGRGLRALCAAFLVVAVSLSGCGYQIHRQAALPFSEVRIGQLKNETLEPKLQDRLHRALAEEFLKQGISVGPSAQYTLTGVITKFEMASLSEKAGIVTEYRVIIVADFTLTDREGKMTQTKNVGSPFIVTQSAQGSMGNLIASKEAAEEEAMKNIAMEIVGALIYK